MAKWGVLPHRMRAAAPQLQNYSHVGMEGPALLDVIFKEKSEILIFMWYFVILNTMGANKTHLLAGCRPAYKTYTGFSSVI